MTAKMKNIPKEEDDLDRGHYLRYGALLIKRSHWITR